MEPDCQRKTLWVAWSVQLMLMSSINVIGNSFLIKTDNFFFFLAEQTGVEIFHIITDFTETFQHYQALLILFDFI